MKKIMKHPNAAIALNVMMGTLAIIANRASAQTDYTFINVADSSGLLGTSFGYPDINDHGMVSFWNVRDDNSSAIYTGDGSAAPTLHVTNQGMFAQLGHAPTINNSGTVALWADAPNPVGRGIYKSTNGVITVVADDNNSFFYDFGNRPSINDSDAVAFNGQLYQPCCDSAIGVGANVLYDPSGPFISFSDCTINSTGVVAFHASLDGFTTNGIFTGTGGSHTTIATTATFSFFVVPGTINDSGDVAFLATLPGGIKGVFIGNGGPITTIATTNGPYSNFSLDGVGFNNNGDMAFRATLDGGTHGIFTGPDPATNTVLKIGDELFGSDVYSLDFVSGLNNHGDIAFTYLLENEFGGAGIAGVAIARAPRSKSTPGDLNGDGSVNVDDLLLVINAWGECAQPCPPSCAADIAPVGGNCSVDVDDLLMVISNWG